MKNFSQIDVEENMEATAAGTTPAEADTSYGLPPKAMCDNLLLMLSSVIEFCESCLTTGKLNLAEWKMLNETNFPRIKMCMVAATRAQADSMIHKLVEWKHMLGPEEWRDLYVVLPTVWAVGGDNPRKEMFRQLMDADRAETHIICSEWPRDYHEARTLLGRVVSDRAIGRFVFGDNTSAQKTKTVGLSTRTDVLQDDAVPAIWDALKREGCPVRKDNTSKSPKEGTTESPIAEMSRLSFC